MCFDLKQAIELFSIQLRDKYGIYEEDYTVNINKEYVVSQIGPNKKGSCGKNTKTGKQLILINPDKFNTADELKTTFYHEFRHVWQRKHKEEENIDHWICWASNHENVEGDFYLFSPTEMDANRFAKSNGEFDDYMVFQKCVPDTNAWKELEHNRDVAKEIAFTEGLYLLNSDTAQRLMDLALICNPEEYNRWVALRNEEAKKSCI